VGNQTRPQLDRDAKRWESEQAFFDDEEYSEGPIPASTIQRYTECTKPWLAAEFPFYILGDVRGKRILEVGCGDGGNAILLALKGARVVGVDISPRAIEIARKRAEMHGVSGRVTFLAMPLELYKPDANDKFDIICGFAVLHHLISVLDQTVGTMMNMAAPGAFVLFTEPIALWRWLRKLRLLLPISVHGTPDERPLEPAELAILARHMSTFDARYHNAATRIVNRFLIRGRYEDFSAPKRMFYDAVARFDEFALNHFGLRGIASSGAFYGTAAPRS
jgi:2-polyprenyl-3-methyl-5-hydroxy-6-metoxy-1,4-benzoquinol methylase